MTSRNKFNINHISMSTVLLYRRSAMLHKNGRINQGYCKAMCSQDLLIWVCIFMCICIYAYRCIHMHVYIMLIYNHTCMRNNVMWNIRCFYRCHLIAIIKWFYSFNYEHWNPSNSFSNWGSVPLSFRRMWYQFYHYKEYI